jgi:hypothetical protein
VQFVYDITVNGNGGHGDTKIVILHTRQMFLVMIDKPVITTGIELTERVLRNY